jgi:hypothetical protein
VGHELENEMIRLKNSAEDLQQKLSTARKLQWSAIDKARLEGLGNQLKSYNENLNKILPIPVALDPTTKFITPTGEFTTLDLELRKIES